MTLTPTSVPITPGSGVNIKTFTDVSGYEYQAVVPTDANGNPLTTDGNGNLNVGFGTGLRQDLDSVTNFANGKLVSALVTATGQPIATAGKVHGIFIASLTGTPTITAYDGSSTSGTLKLPTFTPVVGMLPLFGMSLASGFFLNIIGTVNLVVIYDTTTS